eukprot:590026-Hanusia_phi.AAC.1
MRAAGPAAAAAAAPSPESGSLGRGPAGLPGAGPESPGRARITVTVLTGRGRRVSSSASKPSTPPGYNGSIRTTVQRRLTPANRARRPGRRRSHCEYIQGWHWHRHTATVPDGDPMMGKFAGGVILVTPGGAR